MSSQRQRNGSGAAAQAGRRCEDFIVDRGGALVRAVTPRSGRAYEHRCSLESLTAVAHAVGEAAAAGTTLEEIALAEDLPTSRVATALAFMKERGCVVTAVRRVWPASDGVFEDVMIEYHALREGVAEEVSDGDE